MRIISALKTINYRLWFAILAAMLLPTVYQTVRIFFSAICRATAALISQVSCSG